MSFSQLDMATQASWVWSARRSSANGGYTSSMAQPEHGDGGVLGEDQLDLKIHGAW
jgi:hypothetical protein